jgi:hypothetical protein
LLPSLGGKHLLARCHVSGRLAAATFQNGRVSEK